MLALLSSLGNLRLRLLLRRQSQGTLGFPSNQRLLSRVHRSLSLAGGRRRALYLVGTRHR